MSPVLRGGRVVIAGRRQRADQTAEEKPTTFGRGEWSGISWDLRRVRFGVSAVGEMDMRSESVIENVPMLEPHGAMAPVQDFGAQVPQVKPDSHPPAHASMRPSAAKDFAAVVAAPAPVPQPMKAQPLAPQPKVFHPMAAQPMAPQKMEALPMVPQPMAAQPMSVQPQAAQPMGQLMAGAVPATAAQPMAAQPVGQLMEGAAPAMAAQPMAAQQMTAQPMAALPMGQLMAGSAPAMSLDPHEVAAGERAQLQQTRTTGTPPPFPSPSISRRIK